MKSDSNLIDVPANSIYLPICFGEVGFINKQINPRLDTITDILGLVLVTELLALRNNILYFRFGEADIEGIALLLPLGFQVLAFVLGKLVLGFVCKGIVKLGSDLFI